MARLIGDSHISERSAAAGSITSSTRTTRRSKIIVPGDMAELWRALPGDERVTFISLDFMVTAGGE
jgi:hypothetical protein